MRSRVVLALVPGALVASGWACGSSRGSPGIDAGLDSGLVEASAGDDAGSQPDIGPIDSSSNACKLSDGSDPVAICQQEQILAFELKNAYVKGQGVAPGWSSTAPYAPVAGHAWQDDLGLAGTLGAYLCSSEVYGNNHSTAAFSGTLADIGGVLVSELQQSPPAGVDGEIYFRLRWAEGAYNYIGDSHAAPLEAMADAYGAALASQAFSVAGGGGDAGSPGGIVIGTKNSDGSISYAPAQTVMAAAALLDMAVLGAKGGDAGPVRDWAATALQVLDYVLARGRDPVTGLFYQSLVTSNDPGHDTVGPGLPTNDSMLTETQAWVTLGLTRAQELLAVYQASQATDAGVEAGADGGLPSLPVYWTAANAIAAAITNAGLFDGTSTPPPPPATPPVGAYMEGLILSGSQVLTNKPTVSNSIMLGGLHRVAVGVGVPLAYELSQVRSALLQLQPANSSLLSVVTDDPSGYQQAYLRAASKGFGFAVAVTAGADGGATGQEPGATNYRSDAVHATAEGLTQLWLGGTHPARCAP